MRRRAAKQTMAVEPESLACSLPGPERHVGQGADTNGRLLQHPEARLQGGAPGGDGERGQGGGREGRERNTGDGKLGGRERERENNEKGKATDENENRGRQRR